jgi:phage terminase large subunit
MSKYPGARALLIRKTRASLTQSGLVTFEKFVIPLNDTVTWRTGEQEYRYANGSTIVVGGMDKSIKVMSSEYDIVYVQEATELTEDDWEVLTVRARYGVMPYNQVVGDCNPSYPGHWIKRKIDSGVIKGIAANHTDNPVLWDPELKDWTPRGLQYISKLDALTGVRYKRYRLGLWAAAEGQIYTEWDPDIHLTEKFRIPTDWRRYWVVDFGYTNPFVWEAWAIAPDDTAYLFAEIYQTNLLVEDACALITAWRRENDEIFPDNVIADWDAEDRATMERHLNIQIRAANKQVVNGIHSVKSRLKVRDETKKPGIMIMRDSLLEVDMNLKESMQPTCLSDEVESYEWEDSQMKETPRKVGDHSMDCMRYLSVHLDLISESWFRGMRR